MNLTTHESLLARMGTTAGTGDWEAFYAQYAAVILSFAAKRGLDPDSARDVLQETMLVVMRKLPGFCYDAARGRFRNWLLTIVAHKTREAHRRARADRHVSLDSDSVQAHALHEQLAAEPVEHHAALEDAWRRSLLEEALRRVLEDPHSRPNSVAVFRACALEGETPSDVAARFGMKTNVVYQIKNRLLNRLHALIAELENGGPSEIAPGSPPP